MDYKHLKESIRSAEGILAKRYDKEKAEIEKKHPDVAKSKSDDKPAHGKSEVHARYHWLKSRKSFDDVVKSYSSKKEVSVDGRTRMKLQRKINNL